MSQTTLTSFFNSRKRAATDDIFSSKNKIAHIERGVESSTKNHKKAVIIKKCELLNNNVKVPAAVDHEINGDISQNPCINRKPPTPLEQEKPSTAFEKKRNAANVKNQASPAKNVASARNELSLGDIRKKLAGSSRLAELRATAERLSKGIQDLKSASNKRNLKEFKSIDVEVPSSPSKKSLLEKQLLSPKKDVPVSAHHLISPRKVVVSPVKSPSKVPAYIRHASLATSTSLPLPHQYRCLAELFRGMETVVALLYNRNEKITFNKLKPSIQEMLKRNFTEKNLAQIKHLVPDFYNFEIHKMKSFTKSAQKEVFELVVSPNLPNEMKAMNPSVLLERRRFFYDTLMQLVKKHHTQYLASLDPPMVIPDEKLSRWHPEFELEKVPEIESARLPEMPNAEKMSSAQDVLSKARELFKCNTKMERALEKLAQAKSRGLSEDEKAATSVNTATQTTGLPVPPVTLINPALRNLPASLLEKVRAKQAAKALEAMTQSSEHLEKYYVYTRLPDLTKTLRNVFVTERKNVLALSIVVSKLERSFKANVSASDLQKDIRTLAEEVPELMKLHDIRNTVYLKLDKNADLKKIISKLEALAEKYKSS